MLEQILIKYRSHLVAVCIALIAAWVAIYVNRRTRYTNAADKFRSTMLNELEGLIPINGYWKRDEYIRFNNSIPIIKRAALEFRTAVPFYSKRSFDKAVIEYCNQSQDINWNQAVVDVFYGDETEVTQKEKITKCVYHLLSFTE